MAARVIRLKFAGTCADCGAHLPVGAPARWYGRGKVYGTECHGEKPGTRRGGMTAYELGEAAARGEISEERAEWIVARMVENDRGPGGTCEDAPCCGCCGRFG